MKNIYKKKYKKAWKGNMVNYKTKIACDQEKVS